MHYLHCFYWIFSEKLSKEFTKLLVRSRLDVEKEFASWKRKRSVLWGKVVSNMIAVNADVPNSKDLMQSFLTCLQPTNEEFDDVYGRRHSIQPPAKNLQRMSDCAEAYEVSGDEMIDDSFEGEFARKRPKTATYEALDFFKKRSTKGTTSPRGSSAIWKRKVKFGEKNNKQHVEGTWNPGKISWKMKTKQRIQIKLNWSLYFLLLY